MSNFFKGVFTGYFYYPRHIENRAKQTIEYFYNGTKPLLWGMYE